MAADRSAQAPKSWSALSGGARFAAWFTYGFLIVPSLIIIPMSFTSSTFLEFPPRTYSMRWYDTYFNSLSWREATQVSLSAASLTVVISTLLGTAAAYGLYLAGLRWTRWIYLVLILPLLVPHVLIAIGLFFAFSAVGLLNTLLALAVGHSVIALPFVFVLVSAALKSFDGNLEKAARSLGASRWRAFLTVTLPQIRFSIISGALLAFITSLDEVIISLFVATGPMSSLTRRMFLSLRDTIDPTIAAISTLLVIISAAVVLLSQIFGAGASPAEISGGKRMGESSGNAAS